MPADAGKKPAAVPDDPRAETREKVNLVLSDGFMMFLAILLLPIVGVRIFAPESEINPDVAGFLSVADIAILGVFVLEYFLKLYLARDRMDHFRDPWRLLDLAIILLPLLEFLPILELNLARSTPVFRLLRLLRILAMGSRTVKRRMQSAPAAGRAGPAASTMRIRVVEKATGNIKDGAGLADLKQCIENPSPAWVHVSGVSEVDYEALAGIMGIPRVMLARKLVDESYPRMDDIENRSYIYVQEGQFDRAEHGPRRLIVNQKGLLLVCCGDALVTIRKESDGIFERILESCRQHGGRGDALPVRVLYSIFEHITDRYKEIVGEVEHELVRLESLPGGKTPPKFLETTFQLKKEVNRLVSSLYHLKEVLSNISAAGLKLRGFGRVHQGLFDVLRDEVTYLHETAQGARENLISLIEMHINTTSYDMNRTMKVIAVITCVAVIPTLVGGMLGMNVPGIPVVLFWQLIAATALAMLAIAYIFFKLGWFK